MFVRGVGVGIEIRFSRFTLAGRAGFGQIRLPLSRVLFKPLLRPFLATARDQERKRRTFCETLFFTGCRLSKALEITPKRVEIKERIVCWNYLY